MVALRKTLALANFYAKEWNDKLEKLNINVMRQMIMPRYS